MTRTTIPKPTSRGQHIDQRIDKMLAEHEGGCHTDLANGPQADCVLCRMRKTHPFVYSTRHVEGRR